MRTTRTHYEVLGLPRSATSAQIKRKYKQLASKFHPDVAADKAMAHRIFLQISEAYETLSDTGRRRAYDASLNAEAARPIQTGSQAARPAPSSASPAQLLKDAQWAFIQKRFHEATEKCKEAIKASPRNARAYAVLGDIYRAQGKNSSAVSAYSYAVQYNPNDRDTEKKLTKLMGKRIAPEPVRGIDNRPTTAAAMNAVWWGVAFFLLILIWVHPGKPIPWLAMHMSFISLWSWNLVGLMAAASAVVGVLLSVNGLINHPDEEIVFEGGNWAVVPTGLILLIGSGFFFLGAAAFYAVVGSLQGSLSRSVLIVFAAVLGITVVSALVYTPPAFGQVLLFGGNVSFLACLFGWYIGSMCRPLSES